MSEYTELQKINRRQRTESFELFHSYMAGKWTGTAFLRIFKDMLQRYDEQRRYVKERSGGEA